MLPLHYSPPVDKSLHKYLLNLNLNCNEQLNPDTDNSTEKSLDKYFLNLNLNSSMNS